MGRYTGYDGFEDWLLKRPRVMPAFAPPLVEGEDETGGNPPRDWAETMGESAVCDDGAPLASPEPLVDPDVSNHRSMVSISTPFAVVAAAGESPQSSAIWT